MPLWNFEYTKHSDDFESMKCWEFLLNRLDIVFHRRMIFNFFMISASIFILSIIAFLSSTVSSIHKEITYPFSICIGIILCFIWRILGLYYSEMIYVRSSSVYELERNLAIQVHSYEAEEMGKRKRTALMAISFVESVIPLIMLVLYLLLLSAHFFNTNLTNALRSIVDLF
ncbi:membrane hypothetical protein [Candidatus Xenohaliotis californiensis]|uniref:Uncharacterized protein n=1 Tax=Candidatus Xenohaliotis californiensis TaxID=84677 RepID=A0ABP0ETH6_9RICK|nr:membrane hypothetical protein [Candidatus Xenohaliotis californiensis]